MSANEIEMWPLARLRPYAKNAKTHSADQVAKIAASIAEFGWTVPCLVAEDGELIAGHGRVLAAMEMGLTEAPVIVLEHMTEAQRRAYRIADNKLTELGEWDADLLGDELNDLLSLDFDLSLLGFDDAELDDLLADDDADSGSAAKEDVIPEPPKAAVTRPGDVWVLGEHRLLCGDATVATDVGRVLGDAKPLLMVTDPPYGVEYEPEWRSKARIGDVPIVRTDKVQNDNSADWHEAWTLFPGDVAYVWHPGLHSIAFGQGLESSGFVIRAQIIWRKYQAIISRGHYHWQHEPCFYAVRKTATANWTGDRKQSTVWEIDRVDLGDGNAKTTHSTQKPVECMRRPILNHTQAGDAVYDPFLGSGTTMIAAETTERACYGIELHPAYVDMAVERWQAFTGQPATLADSGQSFADLKSERAAE